MCLGPRPDTSASITRVLAGRSDGGHIVGSRLNAFAQGLMATWMHEECVSGCLSVVSQMKVEKRMCGGHVADVGITRLRRRVGSCGGRRQDI
jgi:hypothetical protein